MFYYVFPHEFVCINNWYCCYRYPTFSVFKCQSVSLVHKTPIWKYISNPNKSITFSHSKLSVASIFDSAFQSSLNRKRSIFFIYKFFFFFCFPFFLFLFQTKFLKKCLVGYEWWRNQLYLTIFFFFSVFFLNTFFYTSSAVLMSYICWITVFIKCV